MKTIFLIISLYTPPHGQAVIPIQVTSMEECNIRGIAAIKKLTDIQHPNNYWLRSPRRIAKYECREL